MKVLKEVAEVKTWRQRHSSSSLGFVPTMGALHDGHLSLIRQAQRECDHCLVSIYLNPTQFDQASDLAHYPKTLTEDLQRLEELQVDGLFLPTDPVMYPDNFTFKVVETQLSNKLCGAQRPGHFTGVLTVVLKLLMITQPTQAYFGEKDFQQLQLIRGLVDAFFLDVKIQSHPIVREADGLAMSSRNRRLPEQDRKLAPQFYRALLNAASAERARAELEQQGFRVDYVEDFNNRRLGAAHLGEVRLIDNVQR